MARFIEGIDREQARLFPERLEDWICEDHLVRVVDFFVDKLDLAGIGFDWHAPARTGRPSYPPVTLLKLFIYGYLTRIPSSRRLAQEAGRNVELMTQQRCTVEHPFGTTKGWMDATHFLTRRLHNVRTEMR